MTRFRANGFQHPWSTDQKATMITYPLVTAGYYILVFGIENNLSRIVSLVVPHLVMALALLTSWYIVESIDPIDVEGKRGIPVVCFKKSKVKTRYCGTCHKPVYGLDHHCTWLNTCVGQRNYIPFLALVTSGFVQMGLQTAVGVLFMSVWLHREDRDRIGDGVLSYIWAYYALVGTFTFVSALLLVSFGILLFFHLYLLFWMHMGTYEWLMSGGTRNISDDEEEDSRVVRQKQEDEQRAKREKEQAWQAMMKENLKKGKKTGKGGSSSSGSSPVEYKQMAVQSKYMPSVDERTGSSDKIGIEMDIRGDYERAGEDETIVEERDGLKASVTRKSGELKPGQVFPFAAQAHSDEQSSRRENREIVESQHSVDFSAR